MSANSHSETNVENTPQNIFDIFHGILVVFIFFYFNSAFIHKREQKLMKHFGFLLKQERSLNVLEFFSRKMLLILFSKGWQLVIVYIKDIAAV